MEASIVMLILPADPPGAQRLMLEVALQRSRCTAVVFGDTAEARQAAECAQLRAEGHPFRQVVWVPDPSVLEGESLFLPLMAAHREGVTTLFVTLAFEIVMRLAGDDALDIIRVDYAFIAAQDDLA